MPAKNYQVHNTDWNVTATWNGYNGEWPSKQGEFIIPVGSATARYHGFSTDDKTLYLFQVCGILT